MLSKLAFANSEFNSGKSGAGKKTESKLVTEPMAATHA